MVTTREAASPWLRHAWDTLETSGARLATRPSGGPGHWDWWCLETEEETGLTTCTTNSIAIRRIGNETVVVHELAHVYTLDVLATEPDHQTAAGLALVFFESLRPNSASCPSHEYLADVITVLTLGDGIEASYWHGCAPDGRPQETVAAAMEVAGSVLSGELPAWFAETYGDASGNPDLEKLWDDVVNARPEAGRPVGNLWRYVVLFHLRNSFGGYCDNQKAEDAIFGRGHARNPWRDGGCVPAAPGIVSFDPGLVDGELVLTWAAPADDGGAPITGYRVEWRSSLEEYDSSRRRVVEDPAARSVSVAGLAADGEHAARVLAFNHNGDGEWAEATARVAAPNRAPEAVGAMADLVLRVGDGTQTVEASDAFRDPDGDTLTYDASSSAPAVARATGSGSTVSVTPVSAGTAAVTVRATDVGGSNASAAQTFQVTVAGNRSPAAVGRLPALTLQAGGVRSVEVSGAFEDPDGDPLMFDATSSDALVATASARGSTVRVSAIWPGTAAVTVTAEDPGGLRAEQTFELTVPNRPPVPVGTLAGLSLAPGGAPASVEVSGAFADPEDDPLTYGASSSEPTVAAVAVSGSTVVVTPLSLGTATARVTAMDVGGSDTWATQTFGVGVDEPPRRRGDGGGGDGGGGDGGGGDGSGGDGGGGGGGGGVAAVVAAVVVAGRIDHRRWSAR